MLGEKSQVPQHGDRAALALRERTCPFTDCGQLLRLNSNQAKENN